MSSLHGVQHACRIDADGAPLDSQPDVRDVIRLLEAGLPRFHPSFLFEEWLAEQLRGAGVSLADTAKTATTGAAATATAKPPARKSRRAGNWKVAIITLIMMSIR